MLIAFLATVGIIGVLATSAVCASAQADTTLKNGEVEIDKYPLERFNFLDRRPTISVFGGTTSFAMKDLSAPIENALALGVELGFRRDKNHEHPSVMSSHWESAYLSYHKGGDVAAATPQIITDPINAFRFGIASRNGYGYKFGSGLEGITFLHGSSGLSWTVLNVADDSLARATNQPLADFGSDVRFGEAWIPSIEVRVAEPVSFHVQYAWNQVYPRHMFWYWLGSGTTEAIADGLVVYFVQEVAKSSPIATPIMYFLLRNGVSAAFKALRMNRMNWPFNTDAPLNMHTFSIGATILF